MSNPTDPKILVVPPGALGESDREALREIGVAVVETEEPERIQFLRSSESLSSTDLLWAAMDALRVDDGYGNKGDSQRLRLAHNVSQLVIEDFKRATTPKAAK